MAYQREDFDDIDKLLQNAYPTLRELFEARLKSLSLTNRQAWLNMEIDFRTLNSILDGQAKNFDGVTLYKLAKFLEVPSTEVIQLYLDSLLKTNQEELERSSKRAFILNHFDLRALKKVGFINDDSDFEAVERKILTFFGIDNLFQYKKDVIKEAAFSSNARKGTTDLARDFWLNAAQTIFTQASNPNPYTREKLIDLFPIIKSFTQNVDKGLFHVSRLLYDIGITMIYLPNMGSVNARGATMSINGKPCVVITNSSQYYPSLWFALIHELHHVLFDWEEINLGHYHISQEEDDMEESIDTKEEFANSFAREYLIASQYMEIVQSKIDDQLYVYTLASELQIHPSIIYIFYCWDNAAYNRKVYSKFRYQMPDFTNCLKNMITFSWDDSTTLKEISLLKTKIYQS